MSNYDFQGLRILVCDDSLQMRALVKTFLHAFGINDIREAADAETGFAELMDFNPDLVITDWKMPEISGLEFVERIRLSLEAPNPYVPVIMLTGYTELDRVKRARDSGVSSYLAKPLSANSLYKRLVSLVEDERLFVRSNDFFGPDRRFNKSSGNEGPERRGNVAA